MGIQREYMGIDCTKSVIDALVNLGVKFPFVVGGSTFTNSGLFEIIEEYYPETSCYSNYSANPTYEEVVEAIKLYHSRKCDGIIAFGGGSAIDVAKCLKAFVNMDETQDYLCQIITDSRIPFIAIPTTAGSGSEATPFAVIYRDYEKISVFHETIKPDVSFLDGRYLMSLSGYQKKSSALDALCHGIESIWAMSANAESKHYAEQAIKKVLNHINEYVSDNCSLECCQVMLEAAHDAGKAISITKTTSAHALSYILTKKYGIAHGHAVALCLPVVWKYMLTDLRENSKFDNTELEERFKYIAHIMGQDSPSHAIEYLEQLIHNDLKMGFSGNADNNDLEWLVLHVNSERLKNNPIKFSNNDLKNIYHRILMERTNEE